MGLERRVKRLCITKRLLLHLFPLAGNQRTHVLEGIPPGAEIQELTVHPATGDLHIYLYHQSFPAIPSTDMVPLLEYTIRERKPEESEEKVSLYKRKPLI